MPTTQDRYPNTIQIGDVRNVTYVDGYLYAADGQGYEVPHFDIVLAGSPCQDFSRAGDGSGTGLKGAKSGLYGEFLRLLHETTPTWFLLENVVMDGIHAVARERITADLKPFGGVRYQLNSADWCAQRRSRLYWTNVPQREVEVQSKGRKAGTLAGIRTTDHDYPVTMQELIGKGYQGIKHLQQWDTTMPKKKERVAPCITASCARSAHKVIVHGEVRMYTIPECEALQTLPSGYTQAAGGDTKRGEVIGDGWTVVVVADLLRGLHISTVSR